MLVYAPSTPGATRHASAQDHRPLASVAAAAAAGGAVTALSARLEPPRGPADARSTRPATTPTSTPSRPTTRPDSLTVVANWIPFEDPAGGPNFYRFDDRAHYYINVDNTRRRRLDVRYQFRFQTKSATRTRSCTRCPA